jgi:heat shock protein HspQ
VNDKSIDPAPAAPAAPAATGEAGLAAMPMATFGIGEIVRHRLFPFRGVIFDVDPTFANTEEWWQSIPENVRPRKDQPFYHLLAENDDASYVAYVSQQNLVREEAAEPVQHPGIGQMFEDFRDGRYVLRNPVRN